MNYRAVIAESWKYTQKHRNLIFWFGFLAAILTTIFWVLYLLYQFFAYKDSYLFNGDDSFVFDTIGVVSEFFVETFSWSWPLIVVAVLYAILYILYPTLAKAAAIQVIARHRNGQKASVGTGFRYGILSFLKLFEYKFLVGTFSFLSLVMYMSLVLRNLGVSIFQFLLPIFLIFIVISLLLTLLFTYAPFYIVIDGKGVFASMRASARLVISQLRHTILITILMLIIGIRIVMQAIMIFLIPGLILVMMGYLATVVLPITNLIIGGVSGVAALLIASYLNGIVDIFTYTVWTFTFLELTNELNEDVSARVMHKNLVDTSVSKSDQQQQGEVEGGENGDA